MLPCCVIIQTASAIILKSPELVNTFSKLSSQIWIFSSEPRFLRLTDGMGGGIIIVTLKIQQGRRDTQTMKKLTPANCLTGLRLLGAVVLIFLAPLSVPFYVVYSLCGLSDALDGPVARTTGTAGDFGARLDSAADMLFYTVMVLRLIPIVWREKILQDWCWWWAVGILVFRIGIYLFALVKFGRFPTLHTMLNKISGFLTFGSAYIIRTPIAVAYFAVFCAVATLAGIEELTIHLYNRKYGGECISLWWLLRATYQNRKDNK